MKTRGQIEAVITKAIMQKTCENENRPRSIGSKRSRGLELFSAFIIAAVLINCNTAAPIPTAAPNPTATPSPTTHRETVTVDAGTVSSVTITLKALNRVEVEISVRSGSGKDIDFWVTGPANETIVKKTRVREQRSFSFIASTSGNYSLNFGNTFTSRVTKVVATSHTIFWR